MCPSEVAFDVQKPEGNIDLIASIVASTADFKQLTREEPPDFREKIENIIKDEYTQIHTRTKSEDFHLAHGFKEKFQLYRATQEAKHFLEQRYREIGINIKLPLYGPIPMEHMDP